MSDRESHPEGGHTDGVSPGDDLRSLELPPGLVAGLRREMRTNEPVPGYVDLAVMSAFADRHAAASSRRNAWRFAAVAASVAAVVWVGSATWPRGTPATNLAINQFGSGSVTGGVTGGVGATVAERLTMGRTPTSVLALADKAERSTTRFDMKSSAPPAAGVTVGVTVALATVDADGNGRVNILDAMRMAKTFEAVRLVRDLHAKTDASGEAGVAMEKAKMAFFVESLDVTWDLTADGVVDQRDADLLTARIVSLGQGGA